MEILEFGDLKNKKLVLIHGFQCPLSVLNKYIEYYKKDFHIIVPILPGHNLNRKEEFVSVKDTVKEFEDFYRRKYGTEIYAVYAMSIGGVFACELWRNQNIHIKKLIMESSPVHYFSKNMISFMTKWYLRMSDKVRNRDNKTLKMAVKKMIVEESLPDFEKLIDNMSDSSIRNYISEIGNLNFTCEELSALYGDKKDLIKERTKVIYFFGSKISESVFKKTGRFIKRYYKSANVCKLKGKGHCEDSLLNPRQWIFTLNQLL